MKNIKSLRETFQAELYAIKLLFSTNILLGVLYLIFYTIDYPTSLINVYIWKLIIDQITYVYSGTADTQQLWFLLGLYIGINVFRSLINNINFNVIRPEIQNASQKILDIRIMRKIAAMDTSFYDDPENRNMLETAQHSQQQISGAMTFLLRETVNIITFIAGLIMFLSVNALVGSIYLLTCLPGIAISNHNKLKMDRYSIKSIPENREKNYYRDLLINKNYAKDIRLYNLSAYFKNIYNRLWIQIRKERAKIFIKGTKLSYISIIISAIGNTFMIAYSVYAIIKGDMTIGMLSMFIALAGKTSGQFLALVMSVPDHYNITIPHINNFRKFLDYENSVKDNGKENIIGTPDIEFCDVCFHYPNSEKNVISHLNLKISAGKKIALIGVNGAGKSTLIKLLLRFYEPQSGKIKLDGKDIKEYSLDELYRLFGVCFQAITGYSMTMRENIAISDINRIEDNDTIGIAAQASGTDKIYEKFINGLDSDMTRKFNDKGYELSGGQWQKVGISRAFFRDSRFIILDEPSSALDPEAEDFIFSSFKKLCKNKGGILISHRLSSIMMVDEVVLLKDGQVIEHGTHADLIKLGGEYAALYNMQAEKYVGKSKVNADA